MDYLILSVLMILLFFDTLFHAVIYFICILFISFLSYMFLCVKEKKQFPFLDEESDLDDE